jgi:hypothetical protein
MVILFPFCGVFYYFSLAGGDSYAYLKKRKAVPFGGFGFSCTVWGVWGVFGCPKINLLGG